MDPASRRNNLYLSPVPARLRKPMHGNGSDDGILLTSDENRAMEEIGLRDPELAELLTSAVKKKEAMRAASHGVSSPTARKSSQRYPPHHVVPDSTQPSEMEDEEEGQEEEEEAQEEGVEEEEDAGEQYEPEEIQVEATDAFTEAATDAVTDVVGAEEDEEEEGDDERMEDGVEESEAQTDATVLAKGYVEATEPEEEEEEEEEGPVEQGDEEEEEEEEEEDEEEEDHEEATADREQTPVASKATKDQRINRQDGELNGEEMDQDIRQGAVDEEDPDETEQVQKDDDIEEDDEHHRPIHDTEIDEDMRQPEDDTNPNAEPYRTAVPRTLHTSYEQVSDYDQSDNEAGLSQDEDEDSEYSEEEDEGAATDPYVIEEMEKFQATFKNIDRKFRLINKIGEGTFSSVYKAEDLEYYKYDNSWDFDDVPRRNGSRPIKYVAIKKIYVTSSPARIQNELELLHDLTGHKSVVPIITAFRHQDQVVAILPYFAHVDFREYFRALEMKDMVLYFKSLFSALEHVHAHGIIHRDIKPTNFLYDVQKGRGVLCDFGLAEREGTDTSYCLCTTSSERPPPRPAPTLSAGYPKSDSRPSRRANRAGTRGFRAPEVLFKCTSQTTSLDIWSAGVILLTILSKRFPFFNSSDDVDAIIEIATIFGKAKMRACAALHGCVFETTIPTIGEKGFTLEKIVLWATNRTATEGEQLPAWEKTAVGFLERCFELDPQKRITAKEALRHEFLRWGEDEDTVL